MKYLLILITFISFIYWKGLIEYVIFMEIGLVLFFFKSEVVKNLFLLQDPKKEVQCRPDICSPDPWNSLSF